MVRCFLSGRLVGVSKAAAERFDCIIQCCVFQIDSNVQICSANVAIADAISWQLSIQYVVWDKERQSA